MTLENVELKIEGMTCGGCAQNVRKALRAVPGVESVDVNLAEGRAHVTILPDAATPTDALCRAVETAGYGAKPAS